MGKSGAKRRKIVRAFGWVLAALSLALVLHPLWFPWVLKPWLNHFGLAFAGYDRIGYTRFELSGVIGQWGGTRLEARHAECVLPTTWLWRRFVSGTNTPPMLSVRNGDLVVARTTPKRTGSEPESFYTVLNRVARIGDRLQQLLPAAELTNCTIRVANTTMLLPEAHWRNGRLHVVVRLPEGRGEIDLVGLAKGETSLQISASWNEYDAILRGEFFRSAAGWRWEGAANWLTNQAEISAEFSSSGWWPTRAQLDCREWRVPGHLIRMPGYEDLTATLAVNMSSNRFRLQTTGWANPSGDLASKGFIPADFSLAAIGDPDSLCLRELKIQSPFLYAELTNPVQVSWDGEFVSSNTQIRVAIDLGKLPDARLKGKAEGSIHVEPDGWLPPRAQFQLAATNIGAGQVMAESVLIRGDFTSPALSLEEVSAVCADGSTISASGSFDVRTREVLSGKWEFSGDLPRTNWPGLNYDRLTASGAASGPLTNLSHQGQIALKGFRNRWLSALDADANWHGQALRLDSIGVAISGGNSRLAFGGTMDLGAIGERKALATLTNVALRRGDADLFALQRSCSIAFNAGGTNTPAPLWALAVDGFEWQGVDRKISVSADLAWPARGILKVNMTNIALGDFSDFLAADIANASLASFDLDAHWSNGPIRSTLSVAGARTNRAGRPILARGVLTTGEALSIQQLSLESGRKPVLTVSGSVPVKVIPAGSGGWLAWNASQTFALQGEWEDQPSERLDLPYPALGSLEVTKPKFSFQIAGTPAAPTASLEASAASISWASTNTHALPTKLEDFRLSADVLPDRIQLRTAGAKLEGLPIAVSGEWRLSDNDWRAFWSERKLPDWDRAHGQLAVESAQVAMLSRYLPEGVSPEGQFSAKLALKAGKQFEGVISLSNAATRPLGSLTPLRDIAAQLRFDGRRATLEAFHCQIGGQPVQADGYLALRNPAGLDYQVHLRGTNVPLARDPEFLLRGDLDLKLQSRSNSAPELSGSVNLHDGLYLRHASALVWSGQRRPDLRPPYFHLTNAPLADWLMDIGISGDRFLRVRTPVFNGLVSTSLKLTGMLREPVLTGDVRVNSGRVLFPFGTLNVNQGFASFNGNDPQGPDLQFNASGRNYRYDIRLEAKGPANVADVTFSSTPPLTSEQILLMLTAGELPQTDFVFSNEARVGRLATFLGKDLLSRFFGADRGEQRLTIRTGENISEEGRLTYSVEYRLSDRWSIIGEYDEFNAFNADLKWKLFAR